MTTTKKRPAKKAAKPQPKGKEALAQKPSGKKTGRPTVYTQAVALEICTRISEGESLRAICRDDHMPALSSVMLWLTDESHKVFSEQYVRAREAQAEHMFLEIAELSDTSVEDIMGIDRSDSARVQARKLQIDTRKWILSRMFPKKYGEKLDVTSDGEKLQPVPIYGGKSTKK